MDPELDEYQVRHVYEHDMRLVHHLLRTEQRGVMIDQSLLHSMSMDQRKSATVAEEQLRQMLGSEFNIRSAVHVQALLFDELKLSPVSFTRHRAPKVDFDTLLTIAASVGPELEPLMRCMLEFRKADKQANSYRWRLDPQGCVHTQYTVHITPTGRLSSRSPNLQNIMDTAKRLFIARPGFVFISRDFSQIEPRVFACLTGDRPWLDTFARGGDIHGLNATDLFGSESWTKAQRDFAKTWLYGDVMYGGTSDTVRKQAMSRLLRNGQPLAGVPSVQEINEAKIRYMIQHPAIAQYQKQIDDQIVHTRMLRTAILGRLRIFLGASDAARRAGYNTPIQGTAADAVNKSYIELSEAMEGTPDGLALQVHDELVLEVRQSELSRYIDLSRSIMEQEHTIMSRKVRFPTSLSIGRCLGEMEKVSE
jgi:DNA polymerase-1